MQTAHINGIDLAFQDSGGKGPVVILSHGFLMDHTMFDAQVAALTPKYRVITWDERGFGGTLATSEFTFWDSANDVLGLMDHLGIDSAVIGGMSQGGFLSLRVALTAPSRVKALSLLVENGHTFRVLESQRRGSLLSTIPGKHAHASSDSECSSRHHGKAPSLLSISEGRGGVDPHVSYPALTYLHQV
jgi:pimeloyl-ACP methyl ester carboxylesterase